MEQHKNDELGFEQIETTDIRISKPFQTAGGDTIRVLFPVGGNAIITSDRKSKMPDIIVDDHHVVESNLSRKSFWGKVWDWIKGLVKDLLGTGGGTTVQCSWNVKPIFDGSGNIIGGIVEYKCIRT